MSVYSAAHLAGADPANFVVNCDEKRTVANHEAGHALAPSPVFSTSNGELSCAH